MKTKTVKCRECGRPYRKRCYDLNLNVGDVVIHESWKDMPRMIKWKTTITDTTYKKDGLYFGKYYNPIQKEMISNVRIDTRNYQFVKL
jgi:hypothetical protein